MKVLLIDNYFYRKGGAEVVFLNTGELLRAAGHEVVYFSFDWGKNLPCEQSKFFPKGIAVDNRGVKSKIKGAINYFYNFDAARNLEQLIVETKPDVAHLHLFWGAMSPSIFGVLKKHNIPVVHTVHDYRMVCPAYAFKDGKDNICEKCDGGKFYNCLLNKCSKGNVVLSGLMTMEMYFRNAFFHPVKNIDSFMYVSDFCRNKHLQCDKRFEEARSVVMYNFQDASVLANVDALIDTYDSYYLFYGRLSFEKGIKTLIQAIERFPDLKLKIVGTGPLEEELKQFCNEKKLENIEFLGFKSGDELFDLVRRAKFTCVPSEWYENNPMTIIESYTLRTPVIGAAIGGITEIVDNGKTGYLFESGSVDDLARAIGEAESMSVENYNAMKSDVERFANKNFGKENYYAKLMDLYKETISLYKK